MTISISFYVVVVLLFIWMLLERLGAVTGRICNIVFGILVVLLTLSIFYVDFHK